jgi:hypothetical protein
METREQCVQYIMAISNLFHEANSQGPNLNVQKCSKKKELAPWSAVFLGLA